MSRPSHATVVAYLALFIAASGGVAFAATRIGSDDIRDDAVRSRQLQDGTIRAADVANQNLTGADVAADSIGRDRIDEATLFNNDTVTGADVAESTLGKVPAATSAAFAVNAERLEGKAASDLVKNGAGFRTVVFPISASLTPGGLPALFGLGDVVLRVDCEAGPELRPVILTGSPASTMVRSATYPSSGDERYSQDNNFTTTEEFDLMPETVNEHDDNTQGTFTYFDRTIGDRHLVTGTFLAEETSTRCIIRGTAAVSSG